VEWQTTCKDIIHAAEDSSHATINVELLLWWQENIRMPLWTPGIIRIWLLASHLEASKILTNRHVLGMQEAPETPDINLNFTIEEETVDGWKEVGLPAMLIDTLRATEQGLDKVNITILHAVRLQHNGWGEGRWHHYQLPWEMQGTYMGWWLSTFGKLCPSWAKPVIHWDQMWLLLGLNVPHLA
jgi:hypothetical protein